MKKVRLGIIGAGNMGSGHIGNYLKGLLPEIEIGDVVYIHDTGAHGFSMGYNYNGKLRSAEVLLKEDGSFQLIRRAETPEDYFATFDFSDFHFGK